MSMIISLLPQLVNSEQAASFLDVNMSDEEKLVLRVSMGPLYNVFNGNCTGHYSLGGIHEVTREKVWLHSCTFSNPLQVLSNCWTDEFVYFQSNSQLSGLLQCCSAVTFLIRTEVLHGCTNLIVAADTRCVYTAIRIIILH